MSAVAHIDQYKEGAFFKDSFRGKLSWNGFENNVLLRNISDIKTNNNSANTPQFVDVGLATGSDTGGDARGMAILDFDNDGDLDIAINHNPGDHATSDQGIAAALLENRIGNQQNWVQLKLVGTTSNRDAIGAKASFEIEGRTMSAQVYAGSSYASQSQRRLHFGLATHNQPLSIEIQWPSGLVERFEQIKINALSVLTEGTSKDSP